MAYWCFLAYDHGEHGASTYDANTALSLYDLEHFEVGG